MSLQPLLYGFLCNFFFVGLFINPNLEEVRNLYKKSPNSKTIALQLYKKLEDVKQSKNGILLAYKGASITLKAKYTKGIKNKKKLFKQGVVILEKQIAKQPNHIELRLIRLSIQENIPKILKYKKNILQDKKFIQNNFKKVKNKKLKSYIKEFVLQSKSFSEEEKIFTFGALKQLREKPSNTTKIK